jgi:23S rRNA (adenine1618-N6)-methyltransferase
MHPHNPHSARYDLTALVKVNPELRPFVIEPRGEKTIDFDNPKAVIALNKALLAHHYGIRHWSIPEKFLCPPIPGRVDYLFYLADLFPGKKKLKGLDIGVGANCIYPLIGHAHFNWDFVGSETDQEALRNAEKLVQENHFTGHIELRLQKNPKNIFEGIIGPDEKFDFSLSNPPFHASAKEAQVAAQRKRTNLKLGKSSKLNFGGKSHELWTAGGELAFISAMIEESARIPQAITWFTSLVSKEANLSALGKKLKSVKCPKVEIINMAQGQKKSRILAWSYARIEGKIHHD